MKILVGLIEHFGDVVACEPVARYLREKYPSAHLAWAIQKPYRELIDANPHIDETIVLGCLTDWIVLYKHSKYDLAIDLHVNSRWCETCRVPLIKDQGNPFVDVFEWFDYGALLEAFCQGAGLPKLSAQPQVYLNERHKAAVDALRLPPQYCVIHRESNTPAKDWPDEKWLSLVRFLVNELKMAVVEVGAKNERRADQTGGDVVGTITAEWDSLVVNLVNRTSLLETAEVIRRARFFVGIDSGPAHLANATKTPGIVLLGRLGYFRQYTPFTGFYASDSSDVRLVRNLTGVVAELTVEELAGAARSLIKFLDERDAQAQSRSEGADSSVGIVAVDESYRKIVLESGFFDRPWYVTHHPEALKNGVDPLDYFVSVGAPSGHSPGAGFDSAWYKSQRPGLEAVTDPLRHYLSSGRSEGLRPCPISALAAVEACQATDKMVWSHASSSRRPTVKANSATENESLPRIFAFYRPHCHPVRESCGGNKQGLSEWDEVIRSEPLFNGHYQPRMPGELGSYDPGSIDVIEKQVRLANDHGIAGFCFYCYFVQGKPLLDKPIENYIKSDIKAPFFFVWTDEHGTRCRDGGNNGTSRDGSSDEDLLFIRELMPVFSDERYVKVDGKPVLGVDKTHLSSNIRQSTELWRDEALNYGFPGLYLVMADDWGPHPAHPRELGFDASYEIPSNLVPEQALSEEAGPQGLKEGFEGRIVDYRKFASFHMGRRFPQYKRFRAIMAPMDNTPRFGSRAMVHVNTDTDAYELWLSQALVDTRRRYPPDERIVFLHSWNEWCEGTYVEPDGRYGRRLLKQTKEVVDRLHSFMTLEQSEVDPLTATYLYRLMREKDEGATRSLYAMREQNMHLYREVEFYRAQITRLEQQLELQQAEHLASLEAAQRAAGLAVQEATDDLRKSIERSRSWRVTKPLRALAELLK